MNSVLASSSGVQSPEAGSPMSAPRGPHRPGSVLGLAWLRGSLHASVFHRQAELGSWSSPHPVRSFGELEAALAAAIAALGFEGGEAYLLLEQAELLHRTEPAPPSSGKALRSHLASRVARHEKDRGKVLWCFQPMAMPRQEAACLLHLLPASFHARLDQAFAAHGLNLRRIFPLSVPLALELSASGGRPSLVAAETDGTTTIVVGGPDGRFAFSRTLDASWTDEPSRVGVEVNRSLLYAKQQLGASIERVRLLGAEPAVADVRARCGEGREIVSLVLRPSDWLTAAGTLPEGHSANLLAGTVGRQKRRGLARAGLMAACWIALAAEAASVWNGLAAERTDRRRYDELFADAPLLRAAKAGLDARDGRAALDRKLLGELAQGRLPPIPAEALAVVSGALPGEIRLTSFQVQREAGPASWSFRLGGTIEADEDTARALLAGFEEKLERGPLAAHFSESVRSRAALQPGPTGDGAGTVSFNLGGTFLDP